MNERVNLRACGELNNYLHYGKMLTAAQGEEFLEKTIKISEKRQRVFNDSHLTMPDFTGSIVHISAELVGETLSSIARETNESCKSVAELIPSPDMNWPDVYVADHDPLVLAWNLMAKKNYTPLIVFNACNTNRGGGVREGSAHIEAEICKRTNYYKALKDLKHKNTVKWPLQDGSIIYTRGVSVFKNSQYKLLNNEFSVDLMGITLPKRPTVINMGTRECYQRAQDSQKVSSILHYVISASSRMYDALILYHLGSHPDTQPQDEFIALVNRAIGLNRNFQRIYYLQPSGSIDDMEEQEKRWNFIKYCCEIDTANPIEREDCREPPREEIVINNAPKRTKRKRVIRKEKKQTDFDETATFDDNKSIAYISSSGDEN